MNTARLTIAQLICALLLASGAASGAPERAGDLLPALSAADMVTLKRAGEACLAANEEAELEPIVQELSALVEAKMNAGAGAGAAEARAAVTYVKQWQDYLRRRNAGYSTKARVRLTHIANLPIGQLMVPRSAVFRRSQETPYEPPLEPPSAPRHVTTKRDDSGNTEISWEIAADDDEWQTVQVEMADRSWQTLAWLPPGTKMFHVPAAATVGAPTLGSVDVVFEEAAQKVLQAKTLQDLDRILAEVAQFWRASRDGLPAAHRAALSKVDAALHFIARWQEAAYFSRAGNDAEAETILESLKESHRVFPLLKFVAKDKPQS